MYVLWCCSGIFHYFSLLFRMAMAMLCACSFLYCFLLYFYYTFNVHQILNNWFSKNRKVINVVCKYIYSKEFLPNWVLFCISWLPIRQKRKYLLTFHLFTSIISLFSLFKPVYKFSRYKNNFRFFAASKIIMAWLAHPQCSLFNYAISLNCR